MKLRDLNPFAPLPSVATLQAEELAELQRALYLEDKRADHHLANARALRERITKLEAPELRKYWRQFQEPGAVGGVGAVPDA